MECSENRQPVNDPQATVVITTKNRKEDLARALASCFQQNVPVEVLVIDDGSDDGTSEMVRETFPRARIHRCEISKGLIVQRNVGAELASCEIIISIDDDAEFSTPDVIATVLQEFSDERIAAVAIPFVNVRQSDEVKQMAPEAEGIWIANEFIGTAHALRRSIFLKLGGYREYLFHQGEEGDLCIRLLERGCFVRLGRSRAIYHYESPRRSFERINVFGQRNLMLFAWHNTPFPEVVVHLVATVLNGLIWGARKGWLAYRLRGTLLGFSAIFHEWGQRNPVSRQTYRMFRKLKKDGSVRLAAPSLSNSISL